MTNSTATVDLPTVTVRCELGNCGGCRGQLVSVTAAHGRPCEHGCHDQAGIDPAEVERARAVLARLDQLVADGVPAGAALDQAEALLDQREGVAA